MFASTRVFCIVLAAVSICSIALAGEVVVPFMGGQAAITEQADGSVSLVIPNMAQASLPGSPALPCIRTRVLLPPNADTSSLRFELRDEVVEDVPGTFVVNPVPPSICDGGFGEVEYWGAVKNVVNGRNVDVYDKDAFYPDSYVVREGFGNLGSYKMVTVQFWPYRYNPVTRQLTHLISGDVAVVFETRRSFAGAQTAKNNPAFRDTLKSMVANWDQADTWYPQPAKLQSVIAPDKTLLIVTTSAIQSASTKLADFVSHKQGLGWTVLVVTEGTWGGGTGDTAANNIRAYLQTQYANYRYALLIGNPHPDTGDVPMKWIYCYYWPETGFLPGASDIFFCDLTGDWDLNDDGWYGEFGGYPMGDVATGGYGAGGIDLVPEMYVGRIPVYDYGNLAELDYYLQKVITYEDTTTYGSWVQRMLLAMNPLDASTPSWGLGEEIRTGVAVPAGREYYRVYDDTYGIIPSPELTPCTEANVVSAWQQHYGFLFWCAHGSDTAADDVFSDNSSPLVLNYPTFVFSASCNNANPVNPINLAYIAMVNNAASVVAATNITFYGIGNGPYAGGDTNQGFCYMYAYQLAGGTGTTQTRCGDAFAAMRSNIPLTANSNNYCLFTLYGDPTLAPKWPTTFQMITAATLPAGKVGQVYAKDLFAAGGRTPYTWSRRSGSLPPGISLYTSPGYLYGTPTTAGTYYFTLRCTKSGGGYVQRTFSLTVTN